MGQEFINYLKNQGINFIENISVSKVEKFTDGFLFCKVELLKAACYNYPKGSENEKDKNEAIFTR